LKKGRFEIIDTLRESSDTACKEGKKDVESNGENAHFCNRATSEGNR
jgi:hypothetical protein